MQIILDIPESLFPQLIPNGTDPSRAALEALALEGYRSDRLSEYQGQVLLGYGTRMQVHQFLADHDTCLNYSVADLEKDLETIRSVEFSKAG